MDEKIKKLKEYFEKRKDIAMAFLFGSRASGTTHLSSDWDIGVYFKPKEYLELESRSDYPNEEKIWSDLFTLLQTNDVDFVILNRAKPSLVYNVLRIGVELKMTDRKMYFDLLCKTSYEAMDWWKFVDEYWRIKEKAHSLVPEEKENLKRYLDFLEDEFGQIQEIKQITWKDYQDDKFKRKIIERWAENLVMAALDIAKIILASDKRMIPQSYKEILKVFAGLYIDADEQFAERFSEFAKLRNIVAHEYLDIRLGKIQKFLTEAEELYPKFIKKVKELLENENENK